jgi:hypothetical protein
MIDMSAMGFLQRYNRMFSSTRPYVRWWWFADVIAVPVLERQLHWVRDNGFGGVEIAWVYPYGTECDPTSVPRLFSSEWRELVEETFKLCEELDLGCDLTYATAWPFCGDFIPRAYSSKLIEGYSSQTVDKSWEAAYLDHPVPVLDHLDAKAVSFYMEYLKERGFGTFATEQPGVSFFCDSLEVEMDGGGYDGILEDFLRTYGFDLRPYLRPDAGRLDKHPEIRYCYRKLIANRYLDAFFSTYVSECHAMGALARIQCHGALTNLLDAYSLADIPESESILFYPDFSLLPASAAAISGKPLVSSETFTCLYGWVPAPQPAPGLKEEEIYDLQCLADAQFAFGVNQIVYHGMPYWGKEFYAGVHVGPDGALAPHFPGFNRYLSKICEYMRLGKVYSHLAVYLPFEDQLMKNEVPNAVKTISDRYYWEMQEVRPPSLLNPYRPVYCSLSQLQMAEIDSCGRLLFSGSEGDAPNLVVDGLYCYSEYLNMETLEQFVGLKSSGASVIFATVPRLAGLTRDPLLTKHFDCLLSECSIDTGLSDVRKVLESDIPLDYWSRWDMAGNVYYLFIAHPDNRNLRYPMKMGYYKQILRTNIAATFHSEQGNVYRLQLAFSDHSSLVVIIDDNTGDVSYIDTARLW